MNKSIEKIKDSDELNHQIREKIRLGKLSREVTDLITELYNKRTEFADMINSVLGQHPFINNSLVKTDLLPDYPIIIFRIKSRSQNDPNQGMSVIAIKTDGAVYQDIQAPAQDRDIFMKHLQNIYNSEQIKSKYNDIKSLAQQIKNKLNQ